MLSIPLQLNHESSRHHFILDDSEKVHHDEVEKQMSPAVTWSGSTQRPDQARAVPHMKPRISVKGESLLSDPFRHASASCYVLLLVQSLV